MPRDEAPCVVERRAQTPAYGGQTSGVRSFTRAPCRLPDVEYVMIEPMPDAGAAVQAFAEVLRRSAAAIGRPDGALA